MRLSDLRAIHEQERHPEVAWSMAFSLPRSLERTRRWVRAAVSAWKIPAPRRFYFSVVRRKDRRWVGLVLVVLEGSERAEVGYGLAPHAWGKGYMTEAAGKVLEWAFAVLGLHRIHANPWTGNDRSVAVLERLGMRREGVMRGYDLFQGVSRDHFLYGMTRDDWNKDRLGRLKRQTQKRQKPNKRINGKRKNR